MKVSNMSGNSENQQEEILQLLREKLPEVFSEGKIDVKQLRATLGEEVLADAERYGLNWAGKMDCFRTIQETTTNTLKPVRDESVDFDNTENLFIEGDNLEVLKVLQKSYYGKVKMIYIDPPYNTGNDFIYNDKFSRNKREYLEEVGAIDKEGNVVNAGLYTQNTKDSGHFHSDWLNMIYPRLFLARNLLRQDGVICISIDDNELNNLRAVMNEIFGEENFIDCLVWKKRYGGGAKEKYFVTLHEYILVYARNLEDVEDITTPLTQDSIERYYILEDGNLATRGKFRTHPLEAGKTMGERRNLRFPIQAPDGTEILPKRQWLWSKDRVEEANKKDELYFVKNNDGWTVHSKQYLIEEDGDVRTGKMQSIIDDIYTQHGTNEIIEMFGNAQMFSFPKPSQLILKLVQALTKKDDLVLDFFAGSGTTAQAVMQLNAKDNGHRKWVCVQLPEKCKPETEAAKAGFVTIADIARERIRRAAKKIQEESGGKIDFGFKAFQLVESNFKIWNTHVTSVEQLEQQMIEMFDNIQPGATKEAMMYELILKSGKELNVAIEEKEAGGEKYFRVNDGSLVICLADKLSKELFAGILVEKPKKIIVLDKSFGNDDQLKTNLLLQAEGAGVDEVRVI